MAAVCAAIFVCQPARADSPALSASYLFPDTAIALQDGDILLTDTPKLTSTLIRQLGNPPGKYSHTVVFIAFPDGTAKLVGFSDHGIKESDPAPYLRNMTRLALVRPTSKPAKGALANAYKTLSMRPLLFDFDMRWPSIDSNRTYCAGFISQLVRLSGPLETDPFKPSAAYQTGFWDDWAWQHLGLSLQQIVSPNAVLAHPHYTLISEYQAQGVEQNTAHWIAESTFASIMRYIEQEQSAIAPIKLGTNMALQLAKMGLMEDMDLLNMPAPRLKAFIPLLEYSERVKSRVQRYIYMHEDQVWDEAAVRALTQSVADYYRDQYFVSAQKK